jgi:hypothetical protein
MPLPTMSLRAAPEHHKLIRDLAATLRTRPELADVLRDVLQAQHGTAARMTERDTAVLRDVVERLSHAEQRIAALEASAPLGSHLRNSEDSGERAAICQPLADTAQSIYETFVDSERTVTRGGTTYTMDTPAEPRVSLRPAQASPVRERPGLRVPEDVQQRVREMRAAGKTRKAIAAELGISTGAVSKYMNSAAD